MGGGDYDGDTVTVIFEPTIVSSFTPQPLLPGDMCQGDTPNGFFEEYFDKSSEVIRDFLETNQLELDSESAVQKYKKVILSSLERRFQVGTYSKM